MAADPVSTAFALLRGVLEADATFLSYVSGIWQMTAPSGSAPDYCLLVAQSAPDTNTATGVRVLTRALFQVKLCGPEDHAANLRTAYARADALLQPSGQPLRNTSGTLACYRESAFALPFGIVSGVQWLSIGGFYRVEV